MNLIAMPAAPAAPARKPMTLVGALNALKRGELVEPDAVGGAVGGLLMPRPMQLAPKPDSLADIAAEQAAQGRTDKEDLLCALRAKRIHNAEDYRLHEAEQQLTEDLRR